MAKKRSEDIPVLKVVNVSKSFGKVQALKNVSLDTKPGEVLGLLGDNGAGKSTLIKIIAGNFHADSGEVFLEEKKIAFYSPAEARKAGIETVYQNSEICQNATVVANFLSVVNIAEKYLDSVSLKSVSWQEKRNMCFLTSVSVFHPSSRRWDFYPAGSGRQSF